MQRAFPQRVGMLPFGTPSTCGGRRGAVLAELLWGQGSGGAGGPLSWPLQQSPSPSQRSRRGWGLRLTAPPSCNVWLLLLMRSTLNIPEGSPRGGGGTGGVSETRRQWLRQAGSFESSRNSSMVLTPEERRKTQFHVPIQDLKRKHEGIPQIPACHRMKKLKKSLKPRWNLKTLSEEQLSLKLFFRFALQERRDEAGVWSPQGFQKPRGREC